MIKTKDRCSFAGPFSLFVRIESVISYLVAKENEIENYSKFLYFYLFIIYSLHRIPFNHSVLYEILGVYRS